jgi:hypothetical protein
MAAHYVWDVRNGTGMKFREFAVLAAVYSVIGNKRYPVRVTRDRIRAGALGYKSKNALFDATGRVSEAGRALLNRRYDHAEPLTTDQVRYTLDSLEARGCFARCHASKRQTYFSNRMGKEEMRKHLLEHKTQRTFVLRLARDADRDLQLQIATRNQENTRPAPQNSPL